MTSRTSCAGVNLFRGLEFLRSSPTFPSRNPMSGVSNPTSTTPTKEKGPMPMKPGASPVDYKAARGCSPDPDQDLRGLMLAYPDKRQNLPPRNVGGSLGRHRPLRRTRSSAEPAEPQCIERVEQHPRQEPEPSHQRCRHIRPAQSRTCSPSVHCMFRPRAVPAPESSIRGSTSSRIRSRITVSRRERSVISGRYSP